MSLDWNVPSPKNDLADHLVQRMDRIAVDVSHINSNLALIKLQKITLFILGLFPGVLSGLFFGLLFTHWTPR
jgi:hypothetical protein